LKNLEEDLERHGEPTKWKRYGDLILANLGTLKRDGDRIVLTDYFDDTTPEITINVDKDLSNNEAAEMFFKRYAKARNAIGLISQRKTQIESDLKDLERRAQQLEQAVESRDVDRVLDFIPETSSSRVKQEKQPGSAAETSGFRRFVSSDDYDILVGKKAADNDRLTFRYANSLDLWLHAADYPGSHVVVRNPTRKDVPQRTIAEAAEIAAFYSDARKQPKAAVHYTQKKFVNKPRRSAPGLVSLASFKTILVEPKVSVLPRD
jgi:predicted ribosome quality control (RQC) complex YloA/Tae2 family protein